MSARRRSGLRKFIPLSPKHTMEGKIRRTGKHLIKQQQRAGLRTSKTLVNRSSPKQIVKRNKK